MNFFPVGTIIRESSEGVLDSFGRFLGIVFSEEKVFRFDDDEGRVFYRSRNDRDNFTPVDLDPVDLDHISQRLSIEKKRDCSREDLETVRELLSVAKSKALLKEASLEEACMKESLSSEKTETKVIKTDLTKEPKKREIIEEMISKVDFSRLKALLSVGGSCGEEIIEVDDYIVEDYLYAWANAKYWFYLLLGKKLKISKAVESVANETDIEGSIKELMQKYPKYISVLGCFPPSAFIVNRCPCEHFLNGYPTVGYKQNSKLSGFLSRYLEDRDFDIDLSKLMQDRKVKGFVSISIDPYDYLTMSTNQHSWSSCHSIVRGCYAVGAPSYMTDNATLICFRENGKEFSYYSLGFNWKGNSKSFRQCVYVDPKTCAAIFSRSYPNQSSQIEDEIRFLYEKQVSNYFGIENKWVIKYNQVFGQYLEGNQFAYHDCLNGYDFLSVRPSSVGRAEPVFEVGGQVFCTICGNPLEDYAVEERVICYLCNDFSDEE